MKTDVERFASELREIVMQRKVARFLALAKRTQTPPSAENALLLLGGHATAQDLCDKMTCPHCGFGLSTSAAQRLMYAAYDAGTITVERDLSLRLAQTPPSYPNDGE